jgi:hypothetical protein
MNTTNLITNSILIDECVDCQLRQSNEGFYMVSPKTGNHFIKELQYNERVRLHWSGFLINNGKKHFKTN